METILIVDDDMMISRVLCHYFEDIGYTVKTAQSGEEALNIVDAVRPAFVIADLRLHGMNGFIFLDKLLERLPETKCLLMTGLIDTEIPPSLKAKGFSHKNISMKPMNLHSTAQLLKTL